jgi:hypothetical protein
VDRAPSRCGFYFRVSRKIPSSRSFFGRGPVEGFAPREWGAAVPDFRSAGLAGEPSACFEFGIFASL